MATISIPRRRAFTLSLPRVSSQGLIYIAVFLIVANLVLVPLALVLLEAVNLGPIHATAGGATLKSGNNRRLDFGSSKAFIALKCDCQ